MANNDKLEKVVRRLVTFPEANIYKCIFFVVAVAGSLLLMQRKNGIIKQNKEGGVLAQQRKCYR